MIRALLFLAIFFSGLLSGGLPVRAAEDGVPETTVYEGIAAFFALSTDAYVNAGDAKGQTVIYRTLDPLPKPTALRSLLNATFPDISLQDDEGQDVIRFAESLAAKTEERYSLKLALLNECLEELLAYRDRMSRLHQEWDFYAKCREGSLQEVREFVERGALINLPGEDGLTPLTMAMSGGNTEVANFIISKGGILSGNMRYEVSNPKEETRDALTASRYEYKHDAEKYHEELLESRQKAAEQQADLQFYTKLTMVLAIASLVLGVLLYKKSNKRDTIITGPFPEGNPFYIPPDALPTPKKIREALLCANKAAAIEAIQNGEPLLMPNGQPVLNHFFQSGRKTDATLLLNLLDAIMMYRDKEMTQKVSLKYLIAIIDRCESDEATQEAVNFFLKHGLDPHQNIHEGKTLAQILEEKGLTFNKAE